MIEELLAADFTFTSPHDDHIDRKTYFERCWPFSDEVRAFEIERLFENGHQAFVTYRAEQKDGKQFRNTEFFTVEDNKIKEVEVYFGRTLIKSEPTISSKTAVEEKSEN
jgi:ketosteroid isomerase-like protein